MQVVLIPTIQKQIQVKKSNMSLTVMKSDCRKGRALSSLIFYIRNTIANESTQSYAMIGLHSYQEIDAQTAVLMQKMILLL